MRTKIIVTSYANLNAKFGPTGVKAVQSKLGDLIEADKRRGIATTVVDLTDPNQTAQYSATAVASARDDKQYKDCIDAVYQRAKPHYLMILGGPDIVPHQTLDDPTQDDASIPSDLPYACEAPYSRDPGKFLAPTRVVGRLPDVSGNKDVNYLTSPIDRVITTKPGRPSDYQNYFAVSAAVWAKSTEINLSRIFHDASKMQLCPPKGSPWDPAALTPRSHFVNCHGGSNDPQWYGQGGGGYPVAMTSADVDHHITAGSIIAAECCYGAQLYAPSSGKPLPICNTYLGSGAVFFFGSTVIAYGPADSIKWADVITGTALIHVLSGLSTGEAVLKARQDYMHQVTPAADPVDVKTMAEFTLLADPSFTPVTVRTLAKIDPEAATAEFHRQAKLTGQMLERNMAVPVQVADSERGGELDTRLRSIAEQYGLQEPSIRTFAGQWTGESSVLESVGPLARFHLLQEERDPQAPVSTHVVVLVREENGNIVAVDEAHAR